MTGPGQSPQADATVVDNNACTSRDAYASLGSLLEAVRLEFALKAKGGPTDGTALSAAIRELLGLF